MSNHDNTEIRLQGIGGSPGICIGIAYIVDREGIEIVEKYPIPDADLKSEINRFKIAVFDAEKELRGIIDNSPEDFQQHLCILETQLVLFKDKMLYGKTLDTIEDEKVNAEWALKKVVTNIASIFHKISDPYLKSRSEDIQHVSDRILRNLVGAKEPNIAEIEKRVILVAKDLSPADTSQIKLDWVKGFATDRGGIASHTSIIARTLGIPAVMGLGDASSRINNDDLLIVDGSQGLLIINPSSETLVEYDLKKKKYEEYKSIITHESQYPAETLDGVSIKLNGNIEMPDEVDTVIENGADGIGLFRTEMLYIRGNEFPSEEILLEQYREVVQKMAPKPVTIRTLDINGDKMPSYNTDLEEANPVLGLRAIRFCLRRPDIFKTQLRAILRAATYGNVRILLPMISSVEEVLEAKRLLEDTARSLSQEGIPYNDDIKLGIMMEVPSAVIMADALAELVDFFSIGTNDLVQYSLAIDRGNRWVAYLYNTLHPAVIRMLKQLADIGHEKGIEIDMCGEMASEGFNMPILLGLGLNHLSMNPKAIPDVKNMIRKLSFKDSRLFLNEVLTKTTTEGIVNLIKETYSHFFQKTPYN